MELMITGMTAVIAGQTITLTKPAGDVSAAFPKQWDCSEIVLTAVAAAAPAEFWKGVALGYKYDVIIRAKT